MIHFTDKQMLLIFAWHRCYFRLISQQKHCGLAARLCFNFKQLSGSFALCLLP